MKRKLLVATTNRGKFEEISNFLSTLPFVECVSLSDLDQEIAEPEETEDTIWGNAFLKAKYYAEKSGLLSLADDSGLFIDALDGWPGHKAARVATDDLGRYTTVLEKMKKIENRGATMQNVLCIYDPTEQKSFSAFGEADISILEKPTTNSTNGFGYDPILFSKEAQKSFSEMDTQEANRYKQRGKALIKIKYQLQNTLASKHMVVPVALIVKDSKLLMIQRNDPHNPKYHEIWEFPGGTVEFGENCEENLRREVLEEAGYKVKIISMLPKCFVSSTETDFYSYQVFVLPYVCKVISGEGDYGDNETLDSKWVDIDQVADQKSFPHNSEFFKPLIPQIKQLIKDYNL